MNRALSILHAAIPALVPARGHVGMRTVTPPEGRGDHLWEIRCLHAGEDKAVAPFLWEPRPRGDYRDCSGDVVDMPQGAFGAGRPSHRSGQVAPPNPLSLADSGIRRNAGLNGGLQ